MATTKKRTPIRLAEDAGTPPTLKIAPLTVTANPKQSIGWGWRWGDRWDDEATGWRGAWAIDESPILGTTSAVRVRIVEDWPLLDQGAFFELLCAAKLGRRPASMADQERMSAELAAAPVGPAEGMARTVDAQLAALISER